MINEELGQLTPSKIAVYRTFVMLSKQVVHRKLPGLIKVICALQERTGFV